jgi:hypothetical protein
MSAQSITRLLQDAARHSREAASNLPQFDLSPLGADGGIYLAGSAHERRETLAVPGSLFAVLTRSQRYARSNLRKWQKHDESVSLAGPRISVSYDHQYNQSFPLWPKTLRARWNIAGELKKSRKRVLVKNIPYEVELRLVIVQHGSSEVKVETVLSEKIDPRRSLIEYPIGRHFWAPSVIHSEPWFEELMSELRSHA